GITGRADGEGDSAPEVAAIVRDGAERPYLPGTTIKGLLRRLGEARSSPEIATLFGEIKDAPDSGQMGAVLVRGARMIKAGNAQTMPFAKATGPISKG